MSETRYTDQHEWVRLDGTDAVVGITRFATEQLGDIVYVELPAIGKKVTAGAEIAVVESVKAASEVYAPVGGEVTAVNDMLSGEPSKVNDDPENTGWIFRIKVVDADEFNKLMGESDYAEFVKGL